MLLVMCMSMGSLSSCVSVANERTCTGAGLAKGLDLRYIRKNPGFFFVQYVPLNACVLARAQLRAPPSQQPAALNYVLQLLLPYAQPVYMYNSRLMYTSTRRSITRSSSRHQ